jgi:hypothetical protein
MARIVARSTQLVMVRIARREQPSATRTRPTPRSKSSVANELDVDVVNSGRSATLLTRSSKVLLSIRSLRQSSCWVRSLYIYIYYDSFDCAFGFDSCSVLFSFFICTGMGGGLHKSFNVKGSRTPASAWLNACRLARRGFIVILVDEYNSSKVTGDFCLQTHRLNATKLQIRCVRVALKSSFIDRFERCVFVFFAVYRKANCVVLVLFWLASIDLRNKGMPNRRCRS